MRPAALERDVGVTADQDRDRPLHRSRLGVHRREVVELAVELDQVALRAPERAQERDVLLAARAAPVPRHAHRLGFLAQPAHPDAVEHAVRRSRRRGWRAARALRTALRIGNTATAVPSFTRW